MRLVCGLMVAMVCGGMMQAQTVSQASLQPRTGGAVPCVPSGDPAWLTPAEKTCYATTPVHDETMEYLRRVQAAARGRCGLSRLGRQARGGSWIS